MRYAVCEHFLCVNRAVLMFSIQYRHILLITSSIFIFSFLSHKTVEHFPINNVHVVTKKKSEQNEFNGTRFSAVFHRTLYTTDNHWRGRGADASSRKYTRRSIWTSGSIFSITTIVPCFSARSKSNRCSEVDNNNHHSWKCIAIMRYGIV